MNDIPEQIGSRRRPDDPAETRRVLAETLRGVADGDRAAFEELYRRTAAKLFGVCLRILPGRAQAEEVLQEAYLSIWQRAAAFDETRGTAMTWLITLTRNRAIDRLRARGAPATVPIEQADDIADDTPDAFDMLAASGEMQRLGECMATLADGDATLIRTAFMQGATYADIATRDGLPLGTVKSRIRRALLKLRECLR